jgi:dolichol kinase
VSRPDAQEDRRQLIHLAMTGFALALRCLTPTQAALCAGAAIALNWVVLPLLRVDMRREGGPFVDGVRLYPIAVLGLVLALPLPLAAAAWGVLGVGDALSNLVGRRFGAPPLLGREDRSLAGSAAFVAGATPAALGLWAFVAAVPPDGEMAVVALVAAVAGALAEFTPRSRWIDDNLPIALAAGVALALLA